MTHTVLYTVGFGIPIIAILTTEFLRWKFNMEPSNDLKFFGRNIPIWVQNSYRLIGILGKLLLNFNPLKKVSCYFQF